ncbi:MAG: enoyl-CoA hydratase/isomerase family protein [Desulfobacteraceae bacterium]|nr:enoyl-CoA hydratase/isomerase family protein [Desulfobacteraceae bacterium]
MVLSKVNGEIACVTLNRPERYNSLVPELLSELIESLEQIEKEASARVIILKANGPVFSTGGDIKGFKDHFDNIESYSKTLVSLLNQTIITMLKIKPPIICEVHGMVTGGSIGLTLASDMVLVTDKTVFRPYYSVVGFCPDGGWTAMLPSIIGKKRCARILMCNTAITAEKALRWGMANAIVPLKNLHTEALSLAEEILAKKPGSIHAVKELLNMDVEQITIGLQRELDGFLAQVQTREAQNGILEFLDRAS